VVASTGAGRPDRESRRHAPLTPILSTGCRGKEIEERERKIWKRERGSEGAGRGGGI
jgi:hypothetical protein